jgi:hypothetical protein
MHKKAAWLPFSKGQSGRFLKSFPLSYFLSFRTHLKNRILVQDSVFALRLRRDTRGGAEFSSVAGLPA